MLHSLYKPGRKYVFHDVGFLKLFWRNISDKDKELVQQYAKKGKLEIVNCGISMNDAVLPKYHEILYNFNNGRKWCEEELGVVSKTSWYIDPFGFGRSHARLLESMGFENLVINRVSYKEKAERRRDHKLMFNWRTKNHSVGLRTAIMPYHYNGSNFTETNRKWVYDDPTSKTFNLYHKFNRMIEDFNDLKTVHKSNMFFDIYGDDFTHQDFDVTLGSYEKLIGFMQYNPQRTQGFRANFSTLSEFFNDLDVMSKAKKRENHISRENPNFVPYADVKNTWWTGFYSTRPKLKSSITRLVATYRSVVSLSTLSLLQTTARKRTPLKDSESAEFHLFNEFLQNTMSILQHHDAITCTSNLAVVIDYEKMVQKANSEISIHLKHVSMLSKYLKAMTSIDPDQLNEFYLCNYVDMRLCMLYDLRANTSVVSVIYNPLRERKVRQSIVTQNADLVLIDSQGIIIPSDIICHSIQVTNIDKRACRLFYSLDLTGNQLAMLLYAKKLNRTENVTLPQIEFNGCKSYTLCKDLIAKVNCSISDPSKLILVDGDGNEFFIKINVKQYFTRDSGPYIFVPAFGTRHSPTAIEGLTLKGVAVAETETIFEVRYYYTGINILLRRFKDDRQKDKMAFEVEVSFKSKNLRLEDTRIYTGREWVLQIESNWVQNKQFFYSQNGLDLDYVNIPKFTRYLNDYENDFGLGECSFCIY
jgi:alpha-mannosidase